MDTKKLRQKILDLAIHGKLVPQDPNDEPASVLLERIRAEKERLMAEGKIKRSKKSDASDTSHYENVPFELPEGWCWCKVTEVLTKLTDGTHHSPTSIPAGDFKYVTAKNIKPWGIDLNDITYVDKATHDEIYTRCNPEIGDILYIKDGATTGVACINDLKEPFSLLSSVALLKPSKQISNRFLLTYLQSSICYDSVRESMKGVGITRITLKIIENWDIPIPPYNEQEKIADSVELWMREIDRIEADSCNIKLYVNSLKSKILDLAIHGKLVPQDPNDETASELLKRINPKAVASCDNPHYEQVPFEIPDNWAWVSIDEINKFKSKSVNPQNYPTDQFELYSVPTFETGEPEYPFGKDVASSKVEVVEGDVLLCKINPHLNRVWVVRRRMTQMKSLASSEWIVIRTDEILPEYLALTMQSPYFRELMMSNVSGVGGSLMRAQPTFVKQYMIPIPPICEQKRIVSKIQESFNTLDSIAESLN